MPEFLYIVGTYGRVDRSPWYRTPHNTATRDPSSAKSSSKEEALRCVKYLCTIYRPYDVFIAPASK